MVHVVNLIRFNIWCIYLSGSIFLYITLRVLFSSTHGKRNDVLQKYKWLKQICNGWASQYLNMLFLIQTFMRFKCIQCAILTFNESYFGVLCRKKHHATKLIDACENHFTFKDTGAWDSRDPLLRCVVLRQSSIRPLDNLHFQILLPNRLMDFDGTWYEWSTQCPLQLLLFVD